MSRCKACDAIVDNPIGRKPNNEPEDLCRKCNSLAHDISVDHEYTLGAISEDPLLQLLNTIDNNEENY